MTCERVRARLTAWLDGEIEEREVTPMQAHLADCPACQQARAELAAISEAADSWQAEGGTVWEAVQAQIAPADLDGVLQELQALRAEITALRAEVSDLRGQLANRPAESHRDSPLLLPYMPPAPTGLRIM
jgi:anti-sigma factor RsiW